MCLALKKKRKKQRKSIPYNMTEDQGIEYKKSTDRLRYIFPINHANLVMPVP